MEVPGSRYVPNKARTNDTSLSTANTEVGTKESRMTIMYVTHLEIGMFDDDVQRRTGSGIGMLGERTSTDGILRTSVAAWRHALSGFGGTLAACCDERRHCEL